jgi:excisionase family DNA binding protein
VSARHRVGTGAGNPSDSIDERRATADSHSAASAHPRRLLTLKETAAYLGVSVWTVRDLVWKEKLRVVRLTRRLHFDMRDVDRLIDVSKEIE